MKVWFVYQFDRSNLWLSWWNFFIVYISFVTPCVLAYYSLVSLVSPERSGTVQCFDRL